MWYTALHNQSKGHHLSIEQVTDLLGQVVSGELTVDQIDHIRNFLLAGVDITSLM